LGDFRIVREIGRGGMGIVYEAVQLSLGRRVALKVLPFAATLDAKQLQRFKNEAQAAAQLHHTNIVPVYAVGVERGVHYYAMQLIEGQNLLDLIRRMRDEGRNAQPGEPTTEDAAVPQPPPKPAPLGHGRETMPQPGAIMPQRGEPLRNQKTTLTPARSTRADLAAEFSTRRATRTAGFYKTAARLIAQAAVALEHAHQLGVIHRDVKPANLMVDERANVWVTDFGLAQFQTCIGLTHTGDLMGTLRYMSPEQAGGQRIAVDARTDVYSLGATLYELLTLETLFDGDDYQMLLRQILNDEPRPPRTLDRAIPPELETIVLKAVSKNAADRYAAAQEFADDLERFLDNRPILARRATLPQRVRKWGQRHPSFVAASVVALVLCSVVSLASTAWVHGEQAKAEAAATSERQRANEALARLRLAQQAVDELFRVSEEELAGKPGTERLRKRILESVLAYYRELIDQQRDDPKAQAELRETEKQVEQIVADLTVLQANGRLDLLRQPAVLDDLRLTPERRADVKDLTSQLDKQWREWFGPDRLHLPPDKARERALDQARRNDVQVRDILNEKQLQRLPQIALQQQGSAAFREPDVAAALKLTTKQRESIRGIDENVFFIRFQDWRRPGGLSSQAREEQEQKRKTALTEIVEHILTEDQRRQWREMTGEPFQGQTPLFPPFFPGQPPGAPGGPGGPGTGRVIIAPRAPQ
jgi:serine/threonine protein kinase